MELKDRIIEAMLAAGLKKLQFANAVGVSSGAVTQWVDGTTKSLKATTAARMQEVTGYSATWLVTGLGEKMANVVVAQDFSGLTPGAIELAALYDLIPVSDRIKRVQAYNAATSAVLEVLQGESATVQPDPHPKKQRA